MAISNIKYGNVTAIAITSADGNGDGVWCSSALVDNTAADTNYIDAVVNGSIQVGTVTADGTLDFYLAYSWDGVLFTAGVDVGDSDITWGTTGNTHVNGEFDLPLLASISVDSTDDDTDIQITLPPITTATGGIMPAEWCIVMENNTGVALHVTGTNNHLEYRGIEFESA